ncbi:MAG: nitroreductase [Candidatus Moranbacteria bacterium]|nr:nitroreductase [Candidatus Moranbacteria bacterium]
MEFEDVIRKRRSIRQFEPEPIPDETIRKILALSQHAPSAGNLQAYRILVVTDSNGKGTLKNATYSKLNNAKQDWAFGAPVIIVICADTEASAERFGERGRDTYSIQDATLFAAYAQLVITSFGLASGWIGNVEEQALKDAFHLPEYLRIVALIPFGHPAGEPKPFERKSLNDILLG